LYYSVLRQARDTNDTLKYGMANILQINIQNCFAN